MENEEVINTIMIWLFPALLVVIWFFYKKDQKQKDDKILKMEDHFEKFMNSQEAINLENTKILTRLTTLQEVREAK